MKKIVFIAALVSIFNFQFSICHAQFSDYGVKVGIGLATIDDDLGTKSPILGATVGGYINYTFAQSESVLAETFMLQTGLSLNRRGSTFQEILEMGADMSIREGYIHAYYLQLPILASLHYELPLRQAGHVLGVFLGPTVNFGLFGRYADRKIHPGSPDMATNYDVNFNGTPEMRKLFNHINRFDVGAMFGFTYEYRNLSASLYIDRGFLATSDGDDILRILENSMSGSGKVEVKIPNGHNVAYMLSLNYKLGNF